MSEQVWIIVYVHRGVFEEKRAGVEYRVGVERVLKRREC
jgi:hypothetical protein